MAPGRPEGCGSGYPPPGTHPTPSPPCRPLELDLPLLQSVPHLPHALCLLLYGVGGLCGIQEGGWPCGCVCPPSSPRPLLPANAAPTGHHGQGVRDIGGAAVADAAAAGHGLGGLRHRRQRRGQPPVTLRWVLPGCAAAVPAPAGQDQALVLKGRGAGCHRPDPAASADLWEFYLPYLYSCISLFGVLLLLRESWDVPRGAPAPWPGLCCGAEPPVPPQDPSGGAGRGRVLGYPLLSLSSRRSLHPLRPLHHVRRHGEAAGETPGKGSAPVPLPQPGVSHPGRGVPFPSPPAGCSRAPRPFPAPGRPGRAAELHEARGSRRVPPDLLWWVPGTAAGWDWGGSGQTGGPSAPPRSPCEPLGVSSLAGKASCWLNLNVELLREEFVALRNKRWKLGEDPEGASKPRIPESSPARPWEHWFPVPHGGRVGVRRGAGCNPPSQHLRAPLNLLPWGGGSCSPLTQHVPPPRRAAAPSVALAEEPGLPPGHAGAAGADGEGGGLPGSWGSAPAPPATLTPSPLLPGHLRPHRLRPRPGAAAG